MRWFLTVLGVLFGIAVFLFLDYALPSRQTVRITNTGAHPAQLISRHWIITDGAQRTEEVRGLGVVGQQPLLPPGESFEYTSGCPLPTPVGTMKGTYHCVGENGVPFEVDIPEFVLAMPRTLH